MPNIPDERKTTAKHDTDDKSATFTHPATGTDSEHPRHVAQNAKAPVKDLTDERPTENGGQAGPEPTRYGDWEKKGRCTDF